MVFSMTKVTKKKNRRLRKQIRKTVGALLMVSAIVVAAIPVTDVSAGEGSTDPATVTTYDDTKMVKVVNYENSDMSSYENYTAAAIASVPSDWQSTVPYVKGDAPIYTTGTSGNVNFQFAFVNPSETASDQVAVILGATINNIPNGNLTIPETVDAYKKYTANTTSTGYCAVNRKGDFLYYKTEAQKQDPNSRLGLYGVTSYTPHNYQSGTAGTSIEITTAYQDSYTEAASGTTQAAVGTVSVKEYVNVLSDGSCLFVVEKSWKEKDAEGNEESKSETTTYAMYAIMIEAMSTCDYDDQEPWINMPDNELYYWNDSGDVDLTAVASFDQAKTNETQRIHDAKVQYIGRQYLTGKDGEWKIAEVVDADTNPENGVFAKKGQIVNLTIGNNLLGIGDAAFYDCSGIKSITLGNGLSTIGNSAFANCVNMTNCSMELHSQITAIGKNAFLNCRALKDITIPVSVKAIGDCCFKGCSGLESIDLCGAGNNVQLNVIGDKVFEGCSSLSSVTFPNSFKQDSSGLKAAYQGGISIRCFTGCTSLQFIKIQNTELDIIDGTNVETYVGKKKQSHASDKDDEINQFLKTVSDSFYFEGPDKVAAYNDDDSPIHATAKIHSASFKYLGEDKYERVIVCPEAAEHVNTFIINSLGELLEMEIDSACKEVEIPSKIGAYGIVELSGNSFKYKCFLEKVTIPNSVKLIESGAFQGCHRLEHVIFEQPENAELVIQDGAFNTQEVDDLQHVKDKTAPDEPAKTCDKKLKETPFLSITGTISETSPTFLYAMNPNNKINRGSQPVTYITFYSGWPTNLTVQYNQDTQEKELIAYPKYENLSSYITASYPYVTTEMATAAASAVTKYDQYKSSDFDPDKRPTEDEMSIVNAALNPVLPAGITAIKTGIFSGLDADGKAVSGFSANTSVESVTCNTVDEIEPYTFSKCTGLTGFWMNGGTKIGDYAFKDCGTNLANVGIGSSLSEMGIRPFAGCKGLTGVSFADNPNFTCEAAVIYGTTNGVKDTIVECLEGRGLLPGVSDTQVGPDELKSVTTIKPEAFKNCDDIVTVDLSTSGVTGIPEQCFAQTDRLSTVILPNGTVRSIDKGAFWNSTLANIRIPDKATLIELEAFADVKTDLTTNEIVLNADGEPTIEHLTSGHKNITMNCPEDSFANTYADKYYYINAKSYEYYTVVFKDGVDFSTLSQQTVLAGEAATPPTPKEHEGLTFIGWDSDGYKSVTEDATYYAQYSGAAYTVTYVDGVTSTVMGKETVEAGKNGNPPTPLTHEGYTFVEWRPSPTGVTEDMICVAYYKDNSGDANRHKCTFYGRDGSVVATYTVNDKDSVTPPAAPAVSGYTFVSWIPKDFVNITEDKVYYASYDKTGSGSGGSSSPSPSKSASPSPTAGSGSSSDNVKKYTVSVSGGSGSGSYAAGAIVALNAYDMGVGKNFDKWTTSTAGVGFANAEATSTTFTMPAANVAITATYKTGGTTASAGGGTTGGGTTGAAGSTGYTGSSSSGSTSKNGTSVEVTKPGISNTNLAGATVAGSTDNFVVKVSEDQNASDMAVAALQARYGNISNIKYLPMDISLYDSTGRTRIADTSGISVNITLPLPDDLAQYAGNNKVASTLGGTLEDLNTRFTTVDGVPCVNFTATHFSPYVIYVDTANLTQSTIDATPKTGDPIHPKWFLAIGLASLSLILFFKKDKKVVKPRTA